MKAGMVEEEAMERLQRRLVKGTLAPHTGGPQRMRSDEVLPIKHVASSTSTASSRLYTTLIGDAPLPDRAHGGKPTDDSVSETVAASTAGANGPPHERMAEYIFNVKDVHRQTVQVYREYMQRVKRGLELKAAASAEDSRTTELGDIALDLKLRVMDKLATAQRIVERTDGSSAMALANLYANIGATTLKTSDLQQDDEGAVPLHLERLIAQAKSRRCAAAARKGPQRAGATTACTLSLTGGVQEVPAEVEVPLSLELQSSASLAPSAHMTTAEARNSWFEAVANASSNDALSSVTLLDDTCGSSALEARLEAMAVDAGLMEVISPAAPQTEVGSNTAAIHRQGCVGGAAPSGIRPEATVHQSPHDDRPVDVSLGPRASPSPAPSIQGEHPLHESVPRCEAPAADAGQPSATSGRRSIVTISEAVSPPFAAPSLDSGIADNVTQRPLQLPSSTDVANTSSSLHVQRRHSMPTQSTALGAGTHDASIATRPTPPDVAPLDAAMFDAEQRVPPVATSTASSRRSTLPSVTAKWACKTCSCESTFHSIKTKMFEDIKRSLRAQYVSTFMNQLECMADEVVAWQSGVMDEMQRLGDVLTALLHEREAAEKEAVSVSQALQQLRQAMGGVSMTPPLLPDAPQLPPVVVPPAIASHSGSSATASHGATRDDAAHRLVAHRTPNSDPSPQSPLSASTTTATTTVDPSWDGLHETSASPDGGMAFITRIDDDGPQQAVAPIVDSGGASPLVDPSFVDPVETTPDDTDGNARTCVAAASTECSQPPSHAVAADSIGGSVPMQRTKSVVGTVKVDWHRFLDEHSPIGASMRRLTATNAALEATIMRAHDHFQVPVESVVAAEGSDNFSFSSTPAQSPRTIGKLRLISTRVGDASTQTLSEEDYFLDNIESVMVAGTSPQPHLAKLAQSVQYASASFSSFKKPSQGSTSAATDAASAATTQRMQQLLLKHIQVPPLIASLAAQRGHRNADDGTNDSDGDNEAEGPTVPTPDAPPLFLRQFAEQLVDIATGVKRFCSELIAARPKPLPSHMHSVAVADVNAHTDAFDEALLLKVQQVASRLGDAFVACAAATQGGTDFADRTAAMQSQAHALQGQLKAADEALLVAKRAKKQLEDANAALEAKLAKALAAQAAASKKDKAPSPVAGKEAQLAKTNRLLDESRQRLQTLMDAVKATLLGCCANSSNDRLAIALEDAWRPTAHPQDGPGATNTGGAVAVEFLKERKASTVGGASPTAVSPTTNNNIDAALQQQRAVSELLNALNVLSTTGGALSSSACPDPLWLRLNHETSKSAELVLEVLRMNHMDMPLDVMESVGRAVRAFGAPNDDETEAEYVVRRAKAARNGEPPPQPAYLTMCDVSASDLAGSISLQLAHINAMMQGARKQLPGLRKQLIKPFAVAARRMVADAREDLRANALAVEWYLKKREAEKHLLEGEDAAAKGCGDGAGSSSSASDHEVDQAIGGCDTSEALAVSQRSMDAASTTLATRKKKHRLPKPLPIDDDDSPLQALLKAMSAYRTHSEQVLEMLTEKKLSIASEQQLGAALQRFAMEQHAPVSLRIRRSLKDVTARMIAIIEGKRIADTLCRDACEGTAEQTVVDTAVQAVSDTTYADGVTEYFVEDFEPYEGDPALIRQAFDNFEHRIVPQAHADAAFQGIGEDYIGVLAPKAEARVATPRLASVENAVDERLSASGLAHEGTSATTQQRLTLAEDGNSGAPPPGADGIAPPVDPSEAGTAHPSTSVTPRIPTFCPLHDRQSTTANRPPLAPGGSRGQGSVQSPSTDHVTSLARPLPRVATASTYVQTSVDMDCMSSLYSRLPLPQLFLFGPVLHDAVDVLEDCNPVDPEIPRMRDALSEMTGLFTYRRAQRYTELGHQMVKFLEVLLDRVVNELRDKVRFARIQSSVFSKTSPPPPGAQPSDATPALKKPPQAPRRGVEVALQAGVETIGAAVQASGKSGGRGYEDSLEDEELALFSFLPLFAQFKVHLETLRGIKEQNKMLALQKSLDAAVSAHPATPVAPPSALESLRVDALTNALLLDDASPVALGRQQSRRLSRGSATADVLLGASFASSFHQTPHCSDLPPSDGTPALEPLEGTVGSNAAGSGGQPPPPTFQSLPLAASALLQLEDSVVVPLRRAMFRCMNEPPFTLPPAPGAAHPRQKFTAASLRSEIAGLQTILRCLQRHAELTSSYRQTLTRLVGMRVQKRRWERLCPQAEVEGLALIDAHSKAYKFLTAKPPTMNARRRREEQARLLQERSEQLKGMLAGRGERLQREVVRLEKIANNLSRQREEHILLFLRDYYFPSSTTGAFKGEPTSPPAPPPHPAATVLPADVRQTVLQDAPPTVAALVAMLWGGGGNSWSSMQQHDDDPKSKSWFDRTGTSQGGGNRAVRFDDMQHGVRVGTTDDSRDIFPQPHGQTLLRQHLTVSADDLERLKKQDYFSWSTSTAGIKTLMSSHNLFSTRKRAPVVGGLQEVLAATAASIPSAASKHVQGGAGLLPLCAMEDESSGGVTVKGWGGLVHLDLPRDLAAARSGDDERALSPREACEASTTASGARAACDANGGTPGPAMPSATVASTGREAKRDVQTPPQLQSQNPNTKSLRAMIMLNRGGPIARPGHTHVPHSSGGTGATLQRLPQPNRGAHTLPVTAPVIDGDVQGAYLMGVGSPTNISTSSPTHAGGSTAQRYSPPPAVGGMGAAPVHRKPGAGVVLAPLVDGPSKVTRR